MHWKNKKMYYFLSLVVLVAGLALLQIDKTTKKTTLSVIEASYQLYPQTDLYQPKTGTIKGSGTPQIEYVLTDKKTLEQTAIPVITKAVWGQINTQHHGQESSVRDLKIWPTGTKEWNWNETGTRHNPGIQQADLQELLDHVDIIILTRGVQSVLQVPQETIDYAIAQGKTVLVGETPVMIDVYNSLVQQGKRVGGLFHSTC